MKKVLAVLLVASTAFAGEKLLGVIESRATTKSNASAAPDGGQQWWDGGYDMPFYVPPFALLTLQCSDSMSVCIDAASCTAQLGVEINAGSLFLTSVGADRVNVATNVDGGQPLRSAQISILVPGTDDGGQHFCAVFERNGKE